MKLKVIVLLVAIIVSYTKLQAQIINTGVEVDLTTSTVKVEDIGNSVINTIHGNDIKGWEAGPFISFGLGPVYVKPKLLFSSQSGNVNVNYNNEQSASANINISKLDIPVLFGLKIIGPLSIEAGPVYNKFLTVTKSFAGNTISISSSGVGYRIGANAQLGVIGLNVSYQGIRNGASGSLSSYSAPDMLIYGASISF